MMMRIALATLTRPLTWLLRVSLACWSCFVVERVAFNAFGIGTYYHRTPTTLLWVLALPFAGYWLVLVRSPLLSTWRGVARGATFAGVSLLLTIGFFYASIMVFSTVAEWSGAQFW